MFWSSVIYYPILVLIFGGIGTLAIFVLGHIWIHKLENTFSTKDIVIGCILASLSFAAIGLVFILRKVYRALGYVDYFYCPNCDVVDNEDEGWCPLCKSALHDKASFILIFGKDQQRIANNVGLKASKEGWLAPGMPAQADNKS